MVNTMALQVYPPGITGTSSKETEQSGAILVWMEMHLFFQAMKAPTGISGIPDKAVAFIRP